MGEFPGSPGAKTVSSQSRGPGLTPDQGTRSHTTLRPDMAKEININKKEKNK